MTEASTSTESTVSQYETELDKLVDDDTKKTENERVSFNCTLLQLFVYLLLTS